MDLVDGQASRWGFFIGPDKTGSSWLHEALATHPSVAVPQAKDLFYFDRFYHRGPEWYLSHFPARPSTEILVEVCHDYLFSEIAAQRIDRFCGSPVFLVGLRHPVERARSAYEYMVRQGRTDLSFSRALIAIPELVEHGRYGALAAAWTGHAKGTVHFLDFRELQSSPRAYFDRSCAALGIPKLELPTERLAPSRIAAEARWRPVARAGKFAAGFLRQLRLERVLGSLKRSAAVERLLFRPLSPSDRAPIRIGDFRHIEGLLGPDAQLLPDGPRQVAQSWWTDDERRRITAST